jgi:histone H3/H4
MEALPEERTEPSRPVVVKKKKSRLFETYISKILKNTPTEQSNGLASNSKQQLNAALCIIAREIACTVNTLTEIAGKKTLFDKEVSNAIRIVLPEELAFGANEYGRKAHERFTSEGSKNDGSSRQAKSGIIFPPSVAEKFLRNFDRSNVMVNSAAPIVFAAALEFIASEILSLACVRVNAERRVRITIHDLELGVRENSNMNALFMNLNLTFLGGGVVSFIHGSLLSKKGRKKGVKGNRPSETPGPKKPHRFRPGTVALREIKKFQKTYDCLTFARSPFEKCVRAALAERGLSFNPSEPVAKISKDVFVVLQHFVEQYVVDILRDANFAAIHAGRRKLMPIDISFVSAIRARSTNPYQMKDLVDNEEVDNEEVDNEEVDNEEVEEEVDNEEVEEGVDNEEVEEGVDNEEVEEGVDNEEVEE